MWANEITIETKATKQQIWKLWSDVSNWNKWDHEVEVSELNGSFKKGNGGFLKPRKGPKAKFELLSADENRSFTSRSFLPLAKMDFIHKLEEKNGELFLTHGVEITGITSFIFSRVIGKKIIAELPKAMRTLSEMAINSKNDA